MWKSFIIMKQRSHCQSMKECMFSYHYNQRRAIVHKDRAGQRILFWVLGVAACYSLYCLSTLVRA